MSARPRGIVRAQERLKEIRAEIEQLEATSTTNGETPAGDDAGQAVRPEARIQRLRELAAAKEKRIEAQKVRLSELERRLSALIDETASSGGGGEVAAEALPDGTDGGEPELARRRKPDVQHVAVPYDVGLSLEAL